MELSPLTSSANELHMPEQELNPYIGHLQSDLLERALEERMQMIEAAVRAAEVQRKSRLKAGYGSTVISLTKSND